MNSGQNYDKIKTSITFTGGVVGNQCICLHYAGNDNSYLRVRAGSKQIIVEQKRSWQRVETLFIHNIALPGYEKENGPSRVAGRIFIQR